MSPVSLPALSTSLREWLDAHADALDEGAAAPESVVPKLAEAGLFSIGVPLTFGGSGGSIADAILHVASVAQHSLTAAFVFWGHRTFIEYLIQSPNGALREAWLAQMLDGRHAGATGLSNAMKYLGGVESLQIQAADTRDGFAVTGKLPWVTNLRKEGFIVAAVAERPPGSPVILAIPNDLRGVVRSADLDLVAMRSSNTAAIDLVDVQLDRAWVIDDDALRFLPRVRPAFLGLQCGLSIGLARRSLHEARHAEGALGQEIAALEHRLAAVTQRVLDGVASNVFRANAAPLFEARIELADVAAAAIALEVQAAGGRGYLRASASPPTDAAPANRAAPVARDGGVARRWREAAFIPIVTPSLTQLKVELARRKASAESTAA